MLYNILILRGNYNAKNSTSVRRKQHFCCIYFMTEHEDSMRVHLWPISRALTSRGVFTANEEENGAMFARLLNKRRRYNQAKVNRNLTAVSRLTVPV